MSDNVVGMNELNEQYRKLAEEAKNMLKDPDRVMEVVETVNVMLDHSAVLRNAAEDIPGLVSYVSDSFSGEYTWASEESLTAVLGALLYLIKIDDAIDDSSPVIGYIDDLRVFTIAKETAGKDLKAYAAWSAEK